MSPVLKTQFLSALRAQMLARRHGYAEQGLTLIELLVVIVIIGILSAIASASFLNTATRARESEAKVNVGAMVRAQQMHYMQQGRFANNLNTLALGIPTQTEHYRYVTRTAQNHADIDGNLIPELALAVALPEGNLRGYMGKGWVDTFNGPTTVRTVVCEGGVGETYFMNSKTYCQ